MAMGVASISRLEDCFKQSITLVLALVELSLRLLDVDLQPLRALEFEHK